MAKYFRSVFISVTLLLVIGCGEQKENVIVYTTHGKDLLESMITQFETAHPNIEVQWIDMGSQDALDRVRSERANPQADIWWGAPAPLFMKAKDENLLQPYQPSWANAIDPIYHDADHHWYGTFLTPEVIGFNSEKLTAETAPQDWDDILQPEWKNRVVIRDPLPSGTMRAIFTAMILRFYGAEQNTGPGFEWLRKLDANTHSYAPDQTLFYLKLSRGEGDVTLWNMPDMLLQKNVNNLPFGYVVPKSGTVVVTDCIALVAGGKNSERAKLFYEFVTSEKAFIEQANKFYRIPSRKDLPKEQLPEWMREELKVLPIDWKIFSEKSDEWIKYWDENIRNQGK
ncbi:MAG: extracellular solute-binding protein [Deferribacteres bacterium]|nr:extracellular solute-binding protein [candidate division KSB1 bacterium]MCB9509063.1 extracellular solute-binding protein [Deferribacteres bacterium]